MQSSRTSGATSRLLRHVPALTAAIAVVIMIAAAVTARVVSNESATDSNVTFARAAANPASSAAQTTSTGTARAAGTANPAVAVRSVGTSIMMSKRSAGIFQDVGGIAGGAGVLARVLFYPKAQQDQIIRLLARSVKIWKIEMGGGTNGTDASEDSIEPVRGQIDCHASYELEIAQLAQRYNPGLQFYFLQWGAPHWVGDGRQSIWTRDDVHYVIDWLTCARKLGLQHITYVGAWNESGLGQKGLPGMQWTIWLHDALRKAGFADTKIVLADSFLPAHGKPSIISRLMDGKTPEAKEFTRDVYALSFHDTCGKHSQAYSCQPATDTHGKPVFLSEIGMLPANEAGADALAQAINLAWIEGHMSAVITWPIAVCMPLVLTHQDRGPIKCDWPWSGYYTISPLLPVLMQTSELTNPGWQFVAGASKPLNGGGSVVAYRSPNAHNWTVVAETTTAHRTQHLTIRLRGLPAGPIHVWSTDLASKHQTNWFVHQKDATSDTMVLLPNHVYTFTTMSTKDVLESNSIGGATPQPLPYSLSCGKTTGLPYLLDDQEGSFRCVSGNTIEQVAMGTPVFWLPGSKLRTPPHRIPFTIVGSSAPLWRNVTVQSKIVFSGPGQTAGLLVRCQHQGQPRPHCYELDVNVNGTWELYAAESSGESHWISGGNAGWLGANHPFKVSLTVRGSRFTVGLNGRTARFADTTRYAAEFANGGPAGFFTGGYYHVLFEAPSVTRA